MSRVPAATSFARYAACFLGLICLAAADPVQAASEEEIWTRAGLRYKPIKRVLLGLDQYLRFDLGPAQVNDVATDVSGAYDPKKWIRLRLGYRYRQRRNSFGRFVPWHRVYADVGLDEKVRKIRLGYRLRYLEQFTWDAGEILDDEEHRRTLRNKVSVGWETDRFVEPELSGELFLRLGGPEGTGFTKYRITAAARFSVGKHDFSVYYRLEDPIRDSNDPHLHILGLTYDFSL